MPYYITTPLFYVNDLPHIGSAYPTIAADFFAGHMLQRGGEVAFLTGADEHGQKIEQAAANNNKSPKEHCDYISGEFKKLWSLLEINYDYFIRTSSEEHKKFVTEFFKKVQANGDIYKGKYTGLYCTHCEDFWLEKDLIQEGEVFLCPTHRKPVEEYSQENYFFALSKYQSKLEKYIADNPEFISPEYRRNEVLGWLKEGLRDFPISRVGLTWGIDVPGDTQGQKIYVWFDALLGYLSGLGSDRDQFWQNNSVVHIIGKDILRFHAVYWPAMLMSAGYPLPKKVFGHGFLTKNGMKMGKTLGNIIDPIALSEKFGAEALKFYFLREIIFGRDGDYTDESFILRLNADLANNLGNLLNRALKLINKNFNSVVPSENLDQALQKEFAQAHQVFINSIDQIDSFTALEVIFRVLDKVNADINIKEPWKLLKNAEPGSDAYKTSAISLATALEACKRAAIYLAPLMPNLALKIFYNLGLIKDLEAAKSKNKTELLKTFFALSEINKPLAGITVNDNPEGIFQRLELDADKQKATL